MKNELVWSLVLAGLLLAGTAHASGKYLFDSHCAVCHQMNGGGVPDYYPPLADSVGAYVHIPAGRAYLVHVVSFGMTGAIASHGNRYDGVMQSWTQLSDTQLAAILNYVLTGLNRKLLPPGFKPYTAAEIARLRAHRESLDQVHEERARMLQELNRSSGRAKKGS